MIRATVLLIAALGLLAVVGGTTGYAKSEPLLMPGKRSLYQRVLTLPGAALQSRPDTTSRKYRLAPFTILYVYQRQRVEAQDWAQVGPDRHKGAIGWIAARHLVDWKQTLTVAFKDPLGHDRALMFRDRRSLKSLINSRDIFGYQLLYEKAAGGEVSSDSPVVAIQPKAYVDVLKDFYIVPILEHEDVYIGNEQGLMLKVTTLPLERAQPGAVSGSAPRDYRSAIVFVIDATVSMGPYIDRTREVVRRVYNSIEAKDLLNKVSFGLVAYRDNLEAVPQLEYLTRTYATLGQGTDPRKFFTHVNHVAPARVSSKGFVEDAYAGVKEAIEEIDWTGYHARYVVLITDAGARPSHDPLGTTGLSAEGVGQLARDKGLSIWVLHLKTSAGASDHASAADQYQRLSLYPGIGEFYYPVQMGSVGDFGRVLETFTREITQQVGEATKGVAPTHIPEEPKDDPLAEFQRKVSTLGYALRMRYLQEAEGGQIPAVFNAWLVDRDIADPARATLEVRVLLTRDQLSDLQYVLKKVLETAEEGVLSPRDFLEELKSVAATISRDPAAASASTRTTGGREQNLVDLGYMREYIEDLPYTGEVMRISLQTWEDWPAKDQLKFIHRIESKISYYEAIHDNTDLWVSLDGGPLTGDSVYPVPLDMLP